MTKAADPSSPLPLIVADIYELAGRFRDQGEAIARKVGQTQARWQVMSAASAGSLTVAQIARRLGVSRQNVQRIADLLVAENSASFMPNPDHKSSPFLILDARGRAALAQITRVAQSCHAGISAKLAPAELTSIHRGLRRLCAAMETSTQPKGRIR